MSPIPQGVNVAHVQAIVVTLRDICEATGDLSGHESFTAAWRFMIEEYAIARVDVYKRQSQF